MFLFVDRFLFRTKTNSDLFEFTRDIFMNWKQLSQSHWRKPLIKNAIQIQSILEIPFHISIDFHTFLLGSFILNLSCEGAHCC